MAFGDRQLGSGELGVIDVAELVRGVLRSGRRIVAMPLLVVGIVRRQATAEATISAQEQQHHPGNEAEDHIRQPEGQQVPRGVEHGKVEQAGQQEQRTDDHGDRRGTAAPAQRSADEDPADDERDRGQQTIRG